MKTIRASDIGAYLFCRRAFWYRLQGLSPQNQGELLSGSELHDRHGRAVAFSGCLRALAYLALLSALALLAIYAVRELL